MGSTGAATVLGQVPHHRSPAPLVAAEVVAEDGDATTEVTRRKAAAFPRARECTRLLAENRNEPVLRRRRRRRSRKKKCGA